MEQFTVPVEGQNDCPETAVTQGVLQASDCAGRQQVDMDGRGSALDNVFCERLWHSFTYENIYLNQYDMVRQLHTGLSAYFDFYNHERLHQSPDYRTQAEEHFVPCSEPAAFARVHLFCPISWSNYWGLPYKGFQKKPSAILVAN